jgi:hypothetical protein
MNNDEINFQQKIEWNKILFASESSEQKVCTAIKKLSAGFHSAPQK